MLYYHFLKSKHAIDSLRNKRIKVSILDYLNDPFELKPYLIAEGRSVYYKVRENLSKKWGLLCFSEDWRQSIMWGHYADKHKGIALGFEINKDIKKVKYVKYREKIKLTDDNKKNEKLFLDKLAFKKYECWEYEKEYRRWVELKNCEKDKSSKDKYYVNFNTNLKIKEIILGCKFNYGEIVVEELKELAKENGISIIIPTREEWSWYRINPCGKKQTLYFPEFKKHN
ncbi:MAG: DUF2971 domain-containing protein [Candidatus Falkowbacteria bacterium]